MEQTSRLSIVIDAGNAEQSLRNLRNALMDLQNTGNDTRRNLDDVGDGLDDLSNNIDDTANNASNAGSRVSVLSNALEGMQTLAMGAGIALGGLGLAVTGAVQEAMRFEDAMAEVKKVIDFDSPQGIQDFRNELEQLSGKLPIAFDGLAKIAAAAGQSGIAKEDILRFTESAAKMGTAFDISAEQAGQAMAEMRVAFKMNQTEVETLADQINYLGNTTPNTAAKITEVVQRIGSLGGIAGVSSSQIAALAGSITAVEPDVAATGIKNMMLALTKGESATKGQREAFESLGLSVANVAKNMQKDSMGTLFDVIERIQKLPKDMQVATINDIFGSEALPIIAQYVDNLDMLKANLAAVGDATKYAGSMNKEYEARAATLSNSLATLKNNFQNAKAAVGESFTPAIAALAQNLQPMLQNFTVWAKANPELIATIVGVTGAILGLVVALGVVAVAFTAVTTGIGAIAAIGTLIGGLFASISSAVGIVGAFGGALAALGFPVTAVVAGIAAIVAGGVLLYQNWDMVKAKAVEVWSSLPQTISTAWESVKAYFAGVGEWFGGVWESIKTVISTKISEIQQAFFTWLAGMPQPVQEMVANIASIFSGMGSIINSVWSWVVGIAQSVAQATLEKWQSFSTGVASLWGELKNTAQSAWNGVVSVASPAINTISSVIKAGLTAIVGVWQIQFVAIKTVVSVALAAIKAVASGGINAIKAIFTAGLTVFASVFNAGFNLIKNAFTTTFNAIKALVRGDMQGVASAIRSGLSTAVSTVRTMVQNIVGAFRNLSGQLLQAGHDAIQGFINGVKGKMSEALATARQMASQVASAVKSALDIHSPSRVMKKLGGHTAEGLAVGIKKDTPKAVKAAKKMAEDVKKAVADGVANLKREITLFNDNSPIAALKYDIGIGKYKGANTAELEALTAQKYALERNKVAYDEIDSIKRELATTGMNALQVLDWEIKNTHKYKDISADVLDKLKEQTAQKLTQLELQDKLNKSMQANERVANNIAAAQKRLALRGNASKVTEFDYDWQHGAFAGADNMQLLRERDLLVQEERLDTADKAKTAFNDLSAKLNPLNPIANLEKEHGDKLTVIQNHLKAQKALYADNAEQIKQVELDAQNATMQALSQFQTAKNDLILSQSEQVFGSMTSIAKSAFGEQSKAYRVMFAMEKGMAIARSVMAIQTAMAQAAANPFPYNLGAMATVASQVANIVSTIKSVAMPVGQAHDGIMSVPKSGTWNLEKGERVLPKHTAKNLDNTLANINSGGVKVIINNYSNEKATAQQMPNGDVLVTIGKMIKNEVKTEVRQQFIQESRQGGMIYRNR